MRQMSRWMEMIHQTIGWRRDEHGTHKHAHGSWIPWSVSRVRSKTKHSLSCITSCYVDSRFFLPLEQSSNNRLQSVPFQLQNKSNVRTSENSLRTKNDAKAQVWRGEGSLHFC